VFLVAAPLLILPAIGFFSILHKMSKDSGVPIVTVIRYNRVLLPFACAECVTIVSAFVCTVRLYRYAGDVTKPLPVAAILIFSAIAVISGLAFIFPQVLFGFQRNPDAILAGEWWRLVTPMFVNPAGWWHYAANAIAALFVLPLAEKFYGSRRLLALYFVSGLVGETCIYTLEPGWAQGGGSSFPIYGVLGSLFIFAFRHRQEFPRPKMRSPILALCLAISLCFMHDFHGAGMLTGALLACTMQTRPSVIPKTLPDKALEPAEK
jgi:rhomboid protease GluP